MSNSNEMLTAAEAAEILSITRAALCARRKKGRGPAWIDLAPEMMRPRVRYRLADILTFRDERHIAQGGQPIPSRVELAERLAVVEKALAKLKRRKRVRQRAGLVV